MSYDSHQLVQFGLKWSVSHVFFYLIPFFSSPFSFAVLLLYIFLCNFSVFISICLVTCFAVSFPCMYVELIVIRLWIFIPFSLFNLWCRSKYTTAAISLFEIRLYVFGSFPFRIFFEENNFLKHIFRDVFIIFALLRYCDAGEWWKVDGMYASLPISLGRCPDSDYRLLFVTNLVLIFSLHFRVISKYCVSSRRHISPHIFPLFSFNFS